MAVKRKRELQHDQQSFVAGFSFPTKTRKTEDVKKFLQKGKNKGSCQNLTVKKISSPRSPSDWAKLYSKTVPMLMHKARDDEKKTEEMRHEEGRVVCIAY